MSRTVCTGRGRCEDGASRDFRDGSFHFFEAGFGGIEGVEFPVIAVEQFEGEDAFGVNGGEVGEDLGQRGDAIAWEDAVGILDSSLRGIGGVIIEVEHL